MDNNGSTQELKVFSLAKQAHTQVGCSIPHPDDSVAAHLKCAVTGNKALMEPQIPLHTELFSHLLGMLI